MKITNKKDVEKERYQQKDANNEWKIRTKKV